MLVQAGSRKLAVVLIKKFEINADNEQKYSGSS